MANRQQTNLLPGTAATIADNAGTWYPIEDMNIPLSILLTGIVATCTVRVWVSNAPGSDPTAPAVEAGKVQYGADISGNGKLEITAPYRFVKVTMPANAGGGSVQAAMYGQIIL